MPDEISSYIEKQVGGRSILCTSENNNQATTCQLSKKRWVKQSEEKEIVHILSSNDLDTALPTVMLTEAYTI